MPVDLIALHEMYRLFHNALLGHELIRSKQYGFKRKKRHFFSRRLEYRFIPLSCRLSLCASSDALQIDVSLSLRMEDRSNVP
jgi:hypothetical protein